MNKQNKSGRRIFEISVFILILISLFSLSYAFTGTGGGIGATSSIGGITGEMQNTSGRLGTMYGGISPVGFYNGIYGGYFGFLSSPGGVNNSTIIITLISPNNNYGTKDSGVTFSANLLGDSPQSCSLIIDGLPNITVDSPGTGNVGFTTSVAVGKHNWTVTCLDSNSVLSYTNTRYITVMHASNFNSETTDFNNTDVTNIVNLTISESGIGKIVFDTPTDLSEGYDLDSNILFGNRSIYVNSNAIPVLNKSATLTMRNIGLQHPVVFRDNVFCSECTILSYTNDLVFTVSHFTNYTATENSQLRIWDDTDTMQKIAGSMINFYANYSNKTNGASISGINAYCNIAIEGFGSSAMAFNSSMQLYEYNQTLGGAGYYNFNVSCNDNNNLFAGINLSDNAVISSNTIGGANVTVISSERGNLTSQPGTKIVQAGNVSQISISNKILSSSWQGYFGNITGKVALVDPNGEKFYDWAVNNPKGEIYASRTPSIDFASINCTSGAEVSSEESFIGQAPTDRDSVTNTFNQTSHPNFDVGLVHIAANACRSTNLFVNSGSQNSSFYEVLLSDGATNIVYTALIDAGKTGFDGKQYDFEMLVGENGHDLQVTPYYFFMDIN